MSRELNALLKRLEKAKQEAIERGVRPMVSAVATVAPASVEVEPENNDAPSTNPRTLVISGTMDYMNALKKLPRQLLEARYRADVGEECPPAPREWVIEKMSRKAQREAYIRFEGEVPASVERNDAMFNAKRVPKYVEEDMDSDKDEPGKDDRKFDPTMKAKAKIGNPFTKGVAYQLFTLVERAVEGIQYQALVLLLKTMNDRAQDWAERKVQKVFTQWVDRGWVELV